MSKSSLAGTAKINVEQWAANIDTKATAAQEKALRKMIADKNGDGKVSIGESITYALDKARNKDKIDRDGDGKISFAEELKWAVDSGKITTSEVNRFLSTDTNGDGAVSKAEQKAYVGRMREQMRKIGG